MKLKYLILLAAAALCSACADPRNDNLPDPQVFLVSSGDQLIRFYDVETTADVNVYVYCSGFDETPAPVSVRLSPEALDKYNQENGTAYQMLDEKYYHLLSSSQVIPAGERNTAFPIRFDCAALTSLSDMQEYAIPLELVAEGNVPINKRKSLVLVRPDMWKAEVVMTTSGMHQQTIPMAQESIVEYEVKFKTEFKNKKDCEFNLDYSKAVLDAYNAANRTLLKPFPEGSFEIVGSPELLAGESEKTLTIRIDPSKITEKGVYSIPVHLVSTSCYEVSQTQNLAVFRVMQAPDLVPQPLDRSAWNNVSCNSYQSAGGYLKMIDDDPKTLWEARYSNGGSFGVTKCPFEIVWDFNESLPINGVGFLRRSEAAYVTDLKSGYIEVSADNDNWYRVAEFDYDKSVTISGPFSFYFEKTDVRYLKFVVTATNRGGADYDACSLAELYTYKY